MLWHLAYLSCPHHAQKPTTECKGIPLLSQMRWGGGGTPSIDEPDKVYPQPVKTDVIIPDEDKVSWLDAYTDFVDAKTAALNADVFSALTVPSTSPSYRGNELPAGYTQVEYLESSGTQYIDTGVIPTNNTSYDLTYLTSFFNDDGALWGARDNVNVATLGGYHGGKNGNLQQQGKFGSQTSVAVSYNKNILYKISVGQDGYYVNDELIHVFTNEVFTASCSFCLFAIKSGGTIGWLFDSDRIFNCKIYNSKILIRDYIPCFDLNNEFGLYDVVGGTFYTNAGTGAFNSETMSYFYTLQGYGSQANPYKISSAMDLAYLSYSSQTNASAWPGKHFELTKDIVLNDGYFEEDGTYHDGGDGKLYEWTSVKNFLKYFNGNNHEISGLYRHALFGIAGEKSVYKNLHVKKAYINDSNAIVFSRNGECGGEYYNVSSGGYITSTTTAIAGLIGGYLNTGNPVLQNCRNYAKVYSSNQNCSGIARGARKAKVVNCANYGYIMSGKKTGGLFIEAYVINIEDCVNHGGIENLGGSDSTTGGIVSDMYGESDLRFTNCVNKGKIISRCWGGTGGIIGRITYGGKAELFNCLNDGDIEGGVYTGGMIGYTAGNGGNIGVYNCTNKGNIKASSYGVAGIWGYQNQQCDYRVINCQNYGNITGSDIAAGIGNFISNCIVKNCYSSGTIKSGLRMNGIAFGGICENCLCEGEIKANNNTGHTNAITTSAARTKNCIFNGKFNGNERKYFYGTDFSAFFVNYKKGYIGLKALESAGVYIVAIPDEEYLLSRGYVKVG